jgi:hypothetical protein
MPVQSSAIAILVKVLNVTKITTAQNDLAEVIGIKTCCANENNNHVDSAITLVPDLLDSIFTVVIKNFSFKMTSLNCDPAVEKDQDGYPCHP